MNPGWLLSKTWAWIARLPFSLYQKTGAAVQEERQNSLPFSLLFIPIVITIDLSTCQLVNPLTFSLVNMYTVNSSTSRKSVSRKEVFQPHLPVRLPCYDLAPITGFALGRSLRSQTSGTPGFHGLTGGVYKARERIHRAVADARLLANPASWGRVADPSPNWDRLSRFDAICITPSLCTGHCNTCVAPDVRAVLI